MSIQYSYVMKDVSKSFPGGRQVLKNMTLSFFPGAKIGIIGTNGAGKSTFLKIMAGVDQEFTGEAWPAKGLSVGYLPQEPILDDDKTVMENIEKGVIETKNILKKFEEVSLRFAEPLSDEEMNAVIEEQSQLQDKIEALGAWELDRTIDIAMDALRCPEGDVKVKNLSGGEKRRVALCQLLLQKPDMLLLDEPTNHLDAESVAWLERYLQEYKGTVVLITHDRYFLDNVVGWILELDRGHGIPYETNYSGWLQEKDKRLSVEKNQEDARRRALQAELAWVQSSPKARQAKSKARLKAYQDLKEQSLEQRMDTSQITIPPGPRLGQDVMAFDHVSKGYGDRLLMDDLSFKITPGAIVGIIGPNGVGKSTLFRMMTGQEQPNEGSIHLGDTVVLGYVDQSRDTLDDAKTVWEEISGGHDEILLGEKPVASRAYCSRFNFKGSDQQKMVGSLSGGERNRVHLAKILRSGANVILLDEPTNDLDIDTLRALEEGIHDFPGCICVTSHDRWFLDRIATHILAFEGESHVEWFEGNYDDYEKDKRRRLGKEATEPKRMRYKPLVR